MAARETVTRKGARLLIEGRLELRSMHHGRVRARCQGDHGTYELHWDRGIEPWCSCPARVACAHLAALRLA